MVLPEKEKSPDHTNSKYSTTSTNSKWCWNRCKRQENWRKGWGITVFTEAGGAVVAATAVTTVAIEADTNKCDGGGDGGDDCGCGGGCVGCGGGDGGCGGWNQDMAGYTPFHKTQLGKLNIVTPFYFLDSSNKNVFSSCKFEVHCMFEVI